MCKTQSVQSNYDAVCDHWSAEFCKWDQERMMNNLHFTRWNQHTLHLQYLGDTYELCRQTGAISNLTRSNAVLSFNTKMALYHILYYAKKNPVNANIWIPFRDVKRAGPYDGAFQRTILRPFADAFSGKLEQLVSIGTQLGFTRVSSADVSFQIELFPCVPIQFLFWDGDDEFPANFNILFDQNITDFTHEETVVCMASDAVTLFYDKLEEMEAGEK